MPYKQTPSVMSTVSLDNITLKQINACIIGILCYTIIPSLTVEAIKKPAKGWNLNP